MISLEHDGKIGVEWMYGGWGVGAGVECHSRRCACSRWEKKESLTLGAIRPGQ